jgi:hypothetical protein
MKKLAFWLPHMTVRISILFALLLLIASTAWAQSAGTKAIPTIEFKSGEKTAVVEGSVSPTFTAGPDMTGGGSERYFLHAEAGQHLTMVISSDDRQALFSIVKPSPAMATYEFVERAGGVKRWSGKLTKSGNYLVVVFTREKETSHFKIRVTLR